MFASPDVAGGGVFREAGMTMTVGWILDHPMADRRAVLWAHNLHVTRSSFRMPAMGDGTFESMGVLLDDVLGEDYVAVGAAFGVGSYPADLPPGGRRFELPAVTVVDGALARVGRPCFLLDLRTVESGSPAARWLDQEREWIAQEATALLVPRAAFDLVFFVGEISRAQPTPLALERYRN